MSCAAKKLLVATSLSCLILAAKRRLPADVAEHHHYFDRRYRPGNAEVKVKYLQ